MSAFIVSEKCMRTIIYNLFWNHTFKNSYSILSRNGYKNEEDFNKLAIELFKMNRDAVQQRYNEREDSEFIAIPEFLNWDNGTTNKYQCLKSLKCLSYQCSEGNVPETKLYKFLQEIINCWMDFIINGIPEYDNASWD